MTDSRTNQKTGRMYPEARSCCRKLFPGRSRSVCVILPATLFLFGLLVFVTSAGAAERPEAAESKANGASSGSTKEDLLLFWDEKEIYVQTATRSEKSLTQVAENMTVVTAKEIEDMNAHTVADILSKVPGLFVYFGGQDFIASSQFSIQGSEPRHVTVLLDGVVWNNLGEGNAETMDIPVRIIDRIEIIKGPASSTWGSALGGVINIITKKPDDTAIASGVLNFSYGEANSLDSSVELSGKGRALGYYLFAGRQSSDGLRDKRTVETNKLYGKLSLTPTSDIDMNFSIGFSDPVSEGGNNPLRGIDSHSDLSSFFVTGSLNYRIGPELELNVAGHSRRQKFDQPIYFSQSSPLYPQLRSKSIVDDQTVGGSIKLTCAKGMHNAVMGADISRATEDATTNYGPSYQVAPFNKPAVVAANSVVDKWALFANDTIDLGMFSLTPGIRFDHNNINGSFVSPSIGATMELAEHSLIRASVARGFTLPPQAYSTTGGFFLAANPSLTSEHGWSYQLGMESALTDYFNVKATLFRHDTTKALVLDSSDPLTRKYINHGDVTRQGYELEAESVPFHGVSLKAAHAYVHTHLDSPAVGAEAGTDLYSYLLGVKYDDRMSLTALLSGSYIWWNDPPASYGARYGTFVWDFTINKKFHTTNRTALELFATVHNLFSGANYTQAALPNANRWVEGGIRFRF
jgi:vitamin B12 transporter